MQPCLAVDGVETTVDLLPLLQSPLSLQDLISSELPFFEVWIVELLEELLALNDFEAFLPLQHFLHFRELVWPLFLMRLFLMMIMENPRLHESALLMWIVFGISMCSRRGLSGVILRYWCVKIQGCIILRFTARVRVGKCMAVDR